MNARMDGDLYHYWVETVFLPYTEELHRTGKILLIIDNSRAGAALETAAKAEENKEQQVNKAEEEVANAKCRKTELAEAVAEAELSVLGAHVKVADAKIAAWQDSSARERQEARDEMSVFDSSDSEEGEDEIGEEEKEDGEQGEDELNPAYIDQDDEWLNW
eukprot:jgi/Tetstr1/455845/TSEL_042635.t1